MLYQIIGSKEFEDSGQIIPTLSCVNTMNIKLVYRNTNIVIKPPNLGKLMITNLTKVLVLLAQLAGRNEHTNNPDCF